MGQPREFRLFSDCAPTRPDQRLERMSQSLGPLSAYSAPDARQPLYCMVRISSDWLSKLPQATTASGMFILTSP